MSESVATLTARLAAIKTAYHSGVLSVTHNGSSSTFRNAREMLQIITSLEAAIAAAGTTTTRRTHLAYQSGKGL